MNYKLQIKKQKKRGFTLVETLVAIAIFSISILSILSILASSITATTYAKDKMIAGYLGQEGIEYIRNIRDDYMLYASAYTPPSTHDWSFFINEFSSCTANAPCGFNSYAVNNMPIQPNLILTPSTFFNCSNDPSETAPSGCVLYFNKNNGVYNDDASSYGVNSDFTRKVWMTKISDNEVQIFSEVDWNQGSGTAKLIFSENLFNWES